MRTKLSSALLALALLTSGVALGAPTDAVQDQETTAEADADVEFGDDEIRTEHGGNATLTVLLNDADEATVKIGSDDRVNYALVVTVTDGNDDGRVVLTFDTDAAGEPNATKVTTDAVDDDATVTDEIEYLGNEPPKPPLDVGNYPITLYSGSAADGDPVETASMVIEEVETTTESTEATTTTTEGPMETTEKSMTTTETTETTTDETAGGVPGFGPVLALVALAAAALLAVRR